MVQIHPSLLIHTCSNRAWVAGCPRRTASERWRLVHRRESLFVVDEGALEPPYTHRPARGRLKRHRPKRPTRRQGEPMGRLQVEGRTRRLFGSRFLLLEWSRENERCALLRGRKRRLQARPQGAQVPVFRTVQRLSLRLSFCLQLRTNDLHEGGLRALVALNPAFEERVFAVR